MHRPATQVLDGMRTSEVKWLHARPGQQQAWQGAARGGPRVLHEARRRWLARWLWWLLAELALPLLRACFYCTESEPYRQQVFYYRCAPVLLAALPGRAGLELLLLSAAMSLPGAAAAAAACRIAYQCVA